MFGKMDFIKPGLSPHHTVGEDLLFVHYHPSDGGIADFCMVQSDDGWHMFHIYRSYDNSMDCDVVGQEIKIGHAVSNDLRTWSWQEPVLYVREGMWDSAHLWAPSVVFHDGLWYMLYTGMKQDMSQKIGVAVSKDLWTWEYPIDEPVIDVCNYSWAKGNPQGYTNCRDPYIKKVGERWLCYYTAMLENGDPAIGIVESKDLLSWKDKGFAVSKPPYNGEGEGIICMESPSIFSKDDMHYLIYNQGHGINYIISDNENDFHDKPVYQLLTGGFNFELLDYKSGLFSFFKGHYEYYAEMRFGYVSFTDEGLMSARTYSRKIVSLS